MMPIASAYCDFDNTLMSVVLYTSQTYCKNKWITIPISRYFAIKFITFCWNCDLAYVFLPKYSKNTCFEVNLGQVNCFFMDVNSVWTKKKLPVRTAVKYIETIIPLNLQI